MFAYLSQAEFELEFLNQKLCNATTALTGRIIAVILRNYSHFLNKYNPKLLQDLLLQPILEHLLELFYSCVILIPNKM